MQGRGQRHHQCWEGPRKGQDAVVRGDARREDGKACENLTMQLFARAFAGKTIAWGVKTCGTTVNVKVRGLGKMKNFIRPA